MTASPSTPERLRAGGSRYSLLAVVGAGFFVAAPIGTWLAVGALTEPSPMGEVLTLDVPSSPLALDILDQGQAEEHELAAPDAPALDLHSFAQNARIVPAFENGRAIGFKLFSIKPGSPFADAGLQNGDVVTRVNGIELTSPERALEAYERAHDGLIVVDFLRRGQRGTITHHVPPISQ